MLTSKGGKYQSLKQAGKFSLPLMIIFLAQQIIYFRLSFTPYSNGYVLLGDFNALHYLVSLFDSDAYRSGIVPLWNPYVFSGYPWATGLEHRVFYPVQIFVSLLFGYSYEVMQVEFVLTVFVGGIGLYLLLSELNLNKISSVYGAISYISSGFFVGNAQAYGVIIVYAFVPWVLLQLYKIYKTKKIVHGVYCSVALTLMVTGGYPGAYIVFGYILALLFIAMIFRSEKPVKMFLSIVMIVGLSMGMSAVHLLHGYSGVMQTERGISLSYEMAVVQHSMSPWDLFTLVLPRAATDPAFSRGSEYVQSITDRNFHLGALLPCLVFVALVFTKNRKMLWAIFGMSVFLLLAAMGDATFVRPFMYEYVPRMDALRHNSQIFRGFTMFFFCIIASFGINHIIEKKNDFGKIWLFFLCPLILIISICIVNLDQAQRSILYADIPIPLAVVAFFVGIFYAFKYNLITTRIFYTLFIILIVIEFSVALNANRGTLWAYAPEFKQKLISAEASRDKTFQNLAKLEREYQVFNGDYYLPLLERIPSDYGYPSTMLSYYQQYLKTKAYSEQRNYGVKRNTVLFPEFVTYYDKNGEVVNHLNSAGIGSLRYAAGLKGVAEGPGARIAHFSGRAAFMGFSKYSLNTVEFKYYSDSDRLALLSQTFYKGWRAFIKESGENIKLGRYNLAFVGLQLPAGSKTVVLEYCPPSYNIGKWISIITAVLSGIVILLIHRKRF